MTTVNTPAEGDNRKTLGWPFASPDQCGSQDKNCDGLSDQTTTPSSCQDNSASNVDSTPTASSNSHRRSALGGGGRFQRYGPNHYGYDIEQERLQQQQQQHPSTPSLPDENSTPIPQNNEPPQVLPLHIRTKQLWYTLPKQPSSPSDCDSHSVDLLSPTLSTAATATVLETGQQSKNTTSITPSSSSSSSPPLPRDLIEAVGEISSKVDGQKEEKADTTKQDEEARRLEERQRHHRAIISGADSAVSLTGDEDLALRFSHPVPSTATTTITHGTTMTSTSTVRTKAIAAVASTLGFSNSLIGSAAADQQHQHPSTSSTPSTTASASYFATPSASSSSTSSSSSASSSFSTASTMATGKYQQPPPPIHKSRNGSLSKATGAAMWRRPQQAITAIKPVPQQMNQPLHAVTTTTTTTAAAATSTSSSSSSLPRRSSLAPTSVEGDESIVVEIGGSSGGSGGGGASAPYFPAQRLPQIPPTAGGGPGGGGTGGGGGSGKTGWEREDSSHHSGSSIFDFFRGRKSATPVGGGGGGPPVAMSMSSSSSSSSSSKGLNAIISYPPALFHPDDPELAPPRPLFIQSSSPVSLPSSPTLFSASSPSPSSSIGFNLPAAAAKGRSNSLTFPSSPFSSKLVVGSPPMTTTTSLISSSSLSSSSSSSFSSPPPPPLSSSNPSSMLPSSSSSSSPSFQPSTPSLAQSAFSKVAAAVVGATVGKRRSSLSAWIGQETSHPGGGVGGGGGFGSFTVSETSFFHKKKQQPQSTADMMGAVANTATTSSSSSSSTITTTTAASSPTPHPLRISSTLSSIAGPSSLTHTSSEPDSSSGLGILTEEQLGQHAQHIQHLQQQYTGGGRGAAPEPMMAYVDQLYRTVRHRELALSLAQEQIGSLEEKLLQTKQTAELEKQCDGGGDDDDDSVGDDDGSDDDGSDDSGGAGDHGGADDSDGHDDDDGVGDDDGGGDDSDDDGDVDDGDDGVLQHDPGFPSNMFFSNDTAGKPRIEEASKSKEQMTSMDENFMAWRTKVHNEQLIIQEEYLHERLIKQDRIEELEEELSDMQDEARRLRERLMVLEYEDDYIGPSQHDRQVHRSHSENDDDDDDYYDVDGDSSGDGVVLGDNDDLESQQQRHRRRRRHGDHDDGDLQLSSQPGPMTLATHKRRSHDFQRLEHRLNAYEKQVPALLKQLEQERADHQQVLIEFRMRMHNKCLKLEEQVQQAKVEALMYTEMMHELAMENEDLRFTTRSKRTLGANGGQAKQPTRRKGSSSWRSFFDFNHEPVEEEDEEEDGDEEEEGDESDESDGTNNPSDKETGRYNDSHMVEISI
ncbi:hypothetical protein DFQ26_005396 [Actinomortierella ambigua]|nr:hypothetical protein DFQ26_005396 [Actinomortierella ambigua]